MASSQFFVLNGEEFNGEKIPIRFRTCCDKFVESRMEKCEKIPSREGLENLNISGSGQFGKAGLDHIVSEIEKIGGDTKHLVICDLRGEPHMILNGYPMSWYNKGDKLGDGLDYIQIAELNREYVSKVDKLEDVLVYEVHSKKNGMPHGLTAHIIDVEEIHTEETLVRHKHCFGYQRIPITDHEKPEIRDADRLISFFQSTPCSSWWHFHCAGGQGRTTTAMIIVDMLENRNRDLTFEDFLNRHYLLGGANFLNISDDPEKAWKREDALARKDFLKLFYEFTKDKEAHSHGLMYFSAWLAKMTN